MRFPLKNKLARFALALTLLLLPTAFARAAAAAGGEVAGTVTDPKGAVVVGASVEVVDAATGAAVATGATDGQGKYSLPNVPAGAYTVVVRAGGFKEARREQLKVEEGKRASADFKLEVALAETSVTVSAAVKG
ncbi:MAG TPA: carboxypeptidase-like regulatory domain-containing protein, partial [Pyrinomonadaceae bacterium]|nr:carboxypeptidase-like regulatory domain-containing protein [Pyrinomonadaceae bacterium]